MKELNEFSIFKNKEEQEQEFKLCKDRIINNISAIRSKNNEDATRLNDNGTRYINYFKNHHAEIEVNHYTAAKQYIGLYEDRYSQNYYIVILDIFDNRMIDRWGQEGGTIEGEVNKVLLADIKVLNNLNKVFRNAYDNIIWANGNMYSKLSEDNIQKLNKDIDRIISNHEAGKVSNILAIDISTYDEAEKDIIDVLGNADGGWLDLFFKHIIKIKGKATPTWIAKNGLDELDKWIRTLDYKTFLATYKQVGNRNSFKLDNLPKL